MSDRRDRIEAELEAIRAANDGILRAEDVVRFAAKRKHSALHGQFEWDDAKAGHQHRLWQAREVIRIHVTIVRHHVEPVRAYVSLPSDRKADGGGYRAMVDVMSNDDLREQMFEMARADYLLFRRKYQALQALAPIFAAAAEVFDEAKAATG